jgi:hypothetical protein
VFIGNSGLRFSVYFRRAFPEMIVPAYPILVVSLFFRFAVEIARRLISLRRAAD